MAGFRVYLPEGAPTQGRADLPRPETHHLVRVLRAREGDAVTLFDGRGHRWEAILTSIGGKRASVEIQSHAEAPPPPRQLVLAMALVKVKTFDAIVRHATEIGVTKIVPLITARNEVKLDPVRTAAKHEHWQAIAIEACKQSGNPWLPEIAAPQSFAAYLQNTVAQEAEPITARYVASLEAGSQPLHELVRQNEKALAREIAVGPVGDFTCEEYAQLRELGYAPVGLGPYVLRCETAALYALSVIAH